MLDASDNGAAPSMADVELGRGRRDSIGILKKGGTSKQGSDHSPSPDDNSSRHTESTLHSSTNTAGSSPFRLHREDSGSQSSGSRTGFESFLSFLDSPTPVPPPSLKKRGVAFHCTPHVAFSTDGDAGLEDCAMEVEQGANGGKKVEADPFLVEAFRAADDDSSGEISLDELKRLLWNLGLEMSNEDLDKWIQKIDADNSGSISFEEFQAIFRNEKESRSTLAKLFRETFDSYDEDGSGAIDKDELRMLMAQLGQDLSDKMLDDMIATVDADGNQEIDFEEFLSLFKGVKVKGDTACIDSAKKPGWNGKTLLRKNTMDSILGGSIFDDAKALIPFDALFRFVMWVYSNRTLVLLCLAHFVATMVIWGHFALIKFQQQEDAVPEGAPRYWAKRIIPPLEFGSMHAILFQMALIPLTMSRYTIAAFSNSKLNYYLPLNKSLRIHIHLGYTMVSIVFLATIVFFTFFGLLCSEGDEAFCKKFTSEIMITGYCILGLLLLMAGTAFFRHKIPYEIFYGVHFLFLVMYSLAIAHTLDMAQRSGKKDRSQTFKWFAMPLIYYLCDYAMMYINQRFKTTVSSFIAVEGQEGSKMIILKILRPTLFNFTPGQYAFLRVEGIDRKWHPFSIASAPNAKLVEFYIEVFEDGSWTHQLWLMLKGHDSKLANLDQKGRRGSLSIELLGPYGTGLVKENIYTNILAIGAGTGIVPCTSLFKQHVQKMLMLEPEAYLVGLREVERQNVQVRVAKEVKEGSLISHLVKDVENMLKRKPEPSLRQSRMHPASSLKSSRQQSDIQANMSRIASQKNTKAKLRLKLSVLKATKAVYGRVLLMLMTLYGVTVFSLTLSWTLTPAEVSKGMITALEVMTLILHAMFFIGSFLVWNGVSLQAYLDAAISVILPFADWFFVRVVSSEGQLGTSQVILLSLLNGYISFRLYQKTLAAISAHDNSERVEHLRFVWTVRTAKVARQIFPEIEETYQSLVDEWGEELASEVLSISIHITEKDKEAAAAFRAEIRNSALFKSKQVFFIRPKLDQILEDHTSELIESRSYSSTLLTFCGGPALSGVLQEEKTKLELYLAALGQSNHSIDFVSESYGGPKSGKQGGADAKDEASSTSLWDLVKQETFSQVNTQRIKGAFDDGSEVDGEVMRRYSSHREMIEDFRSNGNVLRYRSRRRI